MLLAQSTIHLCREGAKQYNSYHCKIRLATSRLPFVGQLRQRVHHMQQQVTAAAVAASLPEPERVLTSDFLLNARNCQPLVALLLNYILPPQTAMFWDKAQLRVCADGGANRLYDELPAQLCSLPAEQVRAGHVPDVICGDLDSVRPEVRRYYEQRGTTVVDLAHDQDSTDLHKCLALTQQRMAQGGGAAPSYTVAALGALGGRLDHTLANLSTLYRCPDLRLVLLGDGSMAQLVRAGRTRVRPALSAGEGPTCGLVPLTGPARATTTGLRWNLSNTELSFGGLLSTSNAIVDEEVVISSDRELVWITELEAEKVV